MFLDIFRFFIEKVMMLEVTILAEKELANANREEEAINDIPVINERNDDTEVIDKMVEDEIKAQTLNRLSKAEMFYL